MSLCGLPNEMLREIAGNLDQETLASLALAHRRLYEVVIENLEALRVQRRPQSTLSFLRIHGSSVRCLDLSQCPVSADLLREMTTKTPKLVTLNVLNSALTYSVLTEILGDLRELERLSVSMLAVPYGDELQQHRRDACVFPPIRVLFIEVRPVVLSMEILIDIFNGCTAVESMHVNVIGRETTSMAAESLLPNVLPQRWQTLTKFVLSVVLSAADTFQYYFLRRLFAHLEQERIVQWLRSEKECYIYENGVLNGEETGNLGAGASFEILGQVEHIKIHGLEHLQELSSSTLEVPRELRLNIWRSGLTISEVFEATRSKMSNLVKLDLADCHGFFSEATRITFFNSCATLEALALPVCLFLSSTEDRFPEEIAGALQRMKLKKLFLKGNLERPHVHRMCSRRDSYCDGCAKALDVKNLPRLDDLKCLEELTFNSVETSESGYDNMVNSRARTIRLNCRLGCSTEGLTRFISRCERLEKFKLKSWMWNLDLKSKSVWDALVNRKTLKQFCFTPEALEEREVPQMLMSVARLSDQLEVLHIHTFRPELQELIRDGISNPYDGVCVDAGSTPLDGVQFRVKPELRPGRSLCYSESFIGQVSPEGWESS